MPSPFPGMDPYLEAPDIWPDFHEALAGEIRGVLNQTLPAPYYARLEMRPEGGVEGPDEQGKHTFVEIRDPRRGHRLVTLLEIVSPSNKQSGVDRRAYEQKHREVYHSDASLIEVDLLRAGERLLHNLHVADAVARLEPSPDYLVLVNRAWLRAGKQVSFQLFHISLREPLPCIPVPLREGEPEILLDLQYVLNRACDSGPYRRGAVDYGQPAEPALREGDAVWAILRLRDEGVVST